MDIVWVDNEEWSELKQHLGKLKGVMLLPKAFKSAMLDPATVNLMYGSRFSAKTETWCRFKLWQIKQEEYSRIIFARRTQKQARDKFFKLFEDIIKNPQLDWKNDFDVHDTKMKITCKATGNEIKGGSFQNSDDVMGSANVTEFGVDEPISREGSISQEAFENVQGSFRNDKGIKPRFYFMTNPIAKNNFIYKGIVDPETRLYDDFKVTKINYTQNPFCPQSGLEYLEGLKKRNFERYKVDGLGEWGNPKVETPFFYNYNPAIHETNETLEPFYNQQIVLSWDFNVKGCTCISSQLINRSHNHDRLGKYVYQTFDADNDDHKGATEKVCDNILRSGLIEKIKRAGTFGLLRITGDVNGNNRSTKSNNTDYQIIRKKLGLSKNHFSVGGVNLGLSSSQDLTNEVLCHIPVTIVKPLNPELCNDLASGEVLTDKDGNFKGIKKDRADNKQDKGDAFRYEDDFYFPGGYDTKGTTRMTVVKWMNKNGLN